MTKVYTVCGCTRASYDAACDDPKSLVEGGMSDFASPQVSPVRRDRPYGRPNYAVYLTDPQPVVTTPFPDQQYLACVIVHELDLEESI